MEGKPLSDQVAVVIGASVGIGAAISVELAKAGAYVVMGARRTDKLAEIKTTIENIGGQAAYQKTDVTVRHEVFDLVKCAETTFGPVDIFVNNSGTFWFSLMKNLHFEEWDIMIDVNCKGFLNGVSSVIESMVKRRKGHIVVISSEAGLTSFPGMAVYSATKFFVEGALRGLRREVSSYDVKVTSIQPGKVDTAMLSSGKTDSEALDMFGDFPPPGVTILDPLDVAKTVVYAVTQPPHVAVNEMIVNPTSLPIPH